MVGIFIDRCIKCECIIVEKSNPSHTIRARPRFLYSLTQEKIHKTHNGPQWVKHGNIIGNTVYREIFTKKAISIISGKYPRGQHKRRGMAIIS